jgi:hypothetical protein
MYNKENQRQKMGILAAETDSFIRAVSFHLQ